MPRPALLCVALVLGAGCSGPDESDSALKPGQVVVVSNPDGAILRSNSLGYSKISPGVTLRVGHDPGELVGTIEPPDAKAREAKPPEQADTIRQESTYRFEPGQKGPKGEPLSGHRYVKVTIESGATAGASGEVYRQDVRPIP